MAPISTISIVPLISVIAFVPLAAIISIATLIPFSSIVSAVSAGRTVHGDGVGLGVSIRRGHPNGNGGVRPLLSQSDLPRLARAGSLSIDLHAGSGVLKGRRDRDARHRALDVHRIPRSRRSERRS